MTLPEASRSTSPLFKTSSRGKVLCFEGSGQTRPLEVCGSLGVAQGLGCVGEIQAGDVVCTQPIPREVVRLAYSKNFTASSNRSCFCCAELIRPKPGQAVFRPPAFESARECAR